MGGEKNLRRMAVKKSQDWSGIIICLATVVIVFTTAFYKKFLPKPLESTGTALLIAIWILFGITIVSGLVVFTMLIRRASKKTGVFDLQETYPRRWAVIQWSSFIVGLLISGVLAGIIIFK